MSSSLNERGGHSSSLITGSGAESLLAHGCFPLLLLLLLLCLLSLLMTDLHGCLLLQPTWLLFHCRPNGQIPLLFQPILIWNADQELTTCPHIQPLLQWATFASCPHIYFIWLPSLVRARVTQWCRSLRLPWLCQRSGHILKLRYTFSQGRQHSYYLAFCYAKYLKRYIIVFLHPPTMGCWDFGEPSFCTPLQQLKYHL